jgi:hypothetical protein
MDIDLAGLMLAEHFASDHHCFGIRCGNCDDRMSGAERRPIMLGTLLRETE